MPRKRKPQQHASLTSSSKKKPGYSCPATGCSWVCPDQKGSKSIDSKRRMFNEHVIQLSISEGPQRQEHLKVIDDLQCRVCNTIFFTSRSLSTHQSKSHLEYYDGRAKSSWKKRPTVEPSLTFGTVPDPMSTVVKKIVNNQIKSATGTHRTDDGNHIYDKITAAQINYEDDEQYGTEFVFHEQQDNDQSGETEEFPQHSNVARGRNSPSYYHSNNKQSSPKMQHCELDHSSSRNFPKATTSFNQATFVDFKRLATNTTELSHLSRFYHAPPSISMKKKSLPSYTEVIQHGSTTFAFNHPGKKILGSSSPVFCTPAAGGTNFSEHEFSSSFGENSSDGSLDSAISGSDMQNIEGEDHLSAELPCSNDSGGSACSKMNEQQGSNSIDNRFQDSSPIEHHNDVPNHITNITAISQNSSYHRFHEETNDYSENNKSRLFVSSQLQRCIRSLNSKGSGLVNGRIHKYVNKISSHQRTITMIPANNLAFLDCFNVLSEPGIPHNVYNRVASSIGRNFISKFESKSEALQISSNLNDFPGRAAITKWVETRVHPQELVHLSKPRKNRWKLPTGQNVLITTNDLEYQLASIFSDSFLMQPDNFIFPNGSDPCTSPAWPLRNRTFSEVNTGLFYEKLTDEINSSLDPEIFRRENVMPMPFLMFIDGTLVSRNSVEPVCICPAIFKRSIRNLPEAWFILGYVEPSSNYVGDIKTTRKVNGVAIETNSTRKITSKEKLLCFHSQLNFILKEFVELQQKGFALDVPISEGLEPGHKRITFIPVLQAVIGDCKGADALCGRYGSHSGLSHLDRDCDVLHIHADCSSHECKYRRREIFDRMNSDEKAEISFHHIPNNAFANISMGNWNDGYGIYSCATPPEHLHLFQLGICEYLWEGFFDKLTNSVQNHLNSVSSRIVNRIYKQTGSSEGMPEIKPFKKGICIRTHEMTGRERFGRIFLLLMCFYDSSFIEKLEGSKKKGFGGRCSEQHSQNSEDEYVFSMQNILRWFQLLQWTVVFDAWITSPSHTSEECMVPLDENNLPRTTSDEGRGNSSFEEPVAMACVRAYMKLYKKVVRRKKGEGLLLTKFHQLLHLVHYVCIHGSLLNIDGGRPEAIIKHLVKVPGRMTQNIAKEICFQSANKLVSFRNMDRLLRMLLEYHPEKYVRYINSKVDPERRDAILLNSIKQDKYYRPRGSTFRIWYESSTCNKTGRERSMKIMWTSGKQYQAIWVSFILAAIESEIFHRRNQENIYHGFTELTRYTRGDDGVSWMKLFLRAHPYYRSKAPWYSWADINWEYDEGVTETCPAKIFMFIQPTSNCKWSQDEIVFVDKDSTNGQRVEIFAIVQSAKERITRRSNTSLTGILDSKWLMEDQLRIVCIEALSQSITVIEETYYDESDKKWMVKTCNRIDSSTSWKDKFIEVVNNQNIL